MTHLALASLTLAEIRERGRDARRMGLDFFTANPFAGDLDLELGDAVARGLAWQDGWMEQDKGEHREEVMRRMRPLLVYPWLYPTGRKAD